MDAGTPGSITVHLASPCPLRLSGSAGPWNTTTNRMTAIWTSANPLAALSRCMSFNKLSGKQKASVKINTTSGLEKTTWPTGVEAMLGMSVLRTWGMVSPMMTRNAAIPPNAKVNWKKAQAMRPRWP